VNDDRGPVSSDPPVPSPTPGPSPGTGGPPDRDARVLALAEYIRANREAFTEDALRRAAADAGYDAREIAAAWAVSAEPARGRGSNARAIFIMVGYFVGVFAVASILSAIPETSLLGLPAIGVGLLGAMFAWLTLRDSNPPLAEAFRLAVIVLVVVPVILVLVGLGVCVVLIVGFRAA
jgi:uncharacterized Tic20 family protein